MDDLVDPMARASPMGVYTNGYDSGPSASRSRGAMFKPDGMIDLSMDDDNIVDPIHASMEQTEHRNAPSPQQQPRGPSPDLRGQASQRYGQPMTNQQYGQPMTNQQYGQQMSSQQYGQPPPDGYRHNNQPSEPAWEWQRGSVRLERRPRSTFGLAVIGGIDKPLDSGETAIIVSDILSNGPACDKLKKNDRLWTVNGISMDGVVHAVAVGALRSAGSTVDIEYRRKVPRMQSTGNTGTLSNYGQQYYPNRDLGRDYQTPGAQSTSIDGPYPHSQAPTSWSGSQRSLTPSQGGRARETVLLTKTRNEGFGMQLGLKLFVQGLSEYGVAANQGVSKGDTIVKINNYPVENLSLADAKRIIQTSGNTLNLEVIREPPAQESSTPKYASRSVDRLDRLSIGAAGHEGSIPRQSQQQMQSQPQMHSQQPRGGYGPPGSMGGGDEWELPPLRPSDNMVLTTETDDPLAPPRPPPPGEHHEPERFMLPPPRPPSPGKQEFMGRSTAL